MFTINFEQSEILTSHVQYVRNRKQLAHKRTKLKDSYFLKLMELYSLLLDYKLKHRFRIRQVSTTVLVSLTLFQCAQIDDVLYAICN